MSATAFGYRGSKEIMMSGTWAIIVAAFGLILTILNIVDKAVVMKERSHRPWEEVTGRLSSLEEWKKDVDRRLDDGDKRFDAIDKGNQVTQKVLLALLDYYLNNGDTEELKKARNELYDYMARH